MLAQELDFRAALGIPDEDHIYILLVDRQGNEFYRARGRCSPAAETALREKLLQLAKESRLS